MAYGIGLDIGIASVGWAVVALDTEENPWGIIKMGSRIFDAAENPKDGASLALPRRVARGTRRRLRRHRHRIERIRNLFLKSGLLTASELDSLYKGKLEDIYTLRVKALDTLVSDQELARILLHLAQRRGFKSNRRADSKDKESGLLKKAIGENEKRMQANRYRTVGEMFCKDPVFAQYKRNKGKSYLTTVPRSMVADEAALVLEKQSELGNEKVTDAFRDEYFGILLSQRQFDEGPGGDSPYAGNQIERMIGTCTFENGMDGGNPEPRAAKSCYSFEYFNLLQKVNHIRLLYKGESWPLDDSQRKKLIGMAKAMPDLNYVQIRKELGLGEGVRFNTLFYKDDTVEKKKKFNYLPVYHQIRNALEEVAPNRIGSYSIELLDEVGRILSTYKGDNKRQEQLAMAGVPAVDIDALLSIGGLSKFCHLSVKALRKIIPFLEQGCSYDKACEAAGYNFHAHVRERSMYLPAVAEEMDEITSPVVRRAVSQTIKVVNAIIRGQGESPLYVNIELAREMAKDFKERQDIDKKNQENRALNDKLMERIRKEFGRQNPSGMDLVKLKLWQEQDGISPYSRKPLEIARLFEPGYADVDHIVPYSISFDDSYMNKVLVFSGENRDKGNRLPIPYLADKFGEKAVDEFKVWVATNYDKKGKKQQNLLKAKITEEDRNNFKERNLQDTKHMSRFLYNYINDRLLFADSETGKKKRVRAVNGAVTSYLRKRWGIHKVRENGDKHHAVDALVIACTTGRMIQEISAFSRNHELEYVPLEKESLLVDTSTGLIRKRFPYPWDDFKKELMARLSDNPPVALQKLCLLYYSDKDVWDIKPIFVSRMPRHKVTGAAHKATVKGARHLDEGIALFKKDLINLKLDKNTGEIEDYYNPESDRLLYDALKARLQKYNGDGKKAFAEPFYKPKADGTPGPLVKKVKCFEKTTLNVLVEKGTGVADNDSMVRVDVFKVEGDGYYLVPIYISDTLKETLPNKAIVAHKPHEQWKEMKEEDFVFSLYPNDLIRVQSKKDMVFAKTQKESDLPDKFSTRDILVYYKGANISTAAIAVVNNDNSYKIEGLGVKTLMDIEKYQVDVLGNYYKVSKEKRLSFH